MAAITRVGLFGPARAYDAFTDKTGTVIVLRRPIPTFSGNEETIATFQTAETIRTWSS